MSELEAYKERRRYALLQAASMIYGINNGTGVKDSVKLALALLAEIEQLESGE